MPSSKNVFGREILPGNASGAQGSDAPKKEPNENVEAAKAALNSKNANRRANLAMDYVRRFEKSLGNIRRCTICLVYNATGNPLTLSTTNDWTGSAVGDGYPEEIANGQWGAFLHVNTNASPDLSAGAVVYRGQNENNKPCDFLLAWFNGIYKTTTHRISRCYAEIAEQEHYDVINQWNDVETKLEKSRLVESTSFYKCKASVKIDSNDRPVFEAILSLKDAGDTLDFNFDHNY